MRKQREDAAVVRQRIEREAMRLFALRGSRAVSVQAIADAVSMSKQAVLYHYGNKEALRTAVLDRVVARVARWFERFTTDAIGSDLHLDALADYFLASYLADPWIPGVVLREILEDPDGVAPALQDGTIGWRSKLVELIRGAQQIGVVRPDVDVDRFFDRTAMMLLATLSLPPRTEPPEPGSEDERELRLLIREVLRIALVSAFVDPSALLD